MSFGINRRKFPRVEYKCRSSINCAQGLKVLMSVTENISTGGLCVLYNEDIGLFSEVSVELFVEEIPMKCEGTVVWILKKQGKDSYVYETGIEFSKIEEKDKRKLYEKVDNLLKGNSDS